MRVNLLHRAGAEQLALPHGEDLVLDLGLDAIIATGAGGDEVVREVLGSVIIHPLTTASDIVFRQEVMRDFLQNPELLRSLYDLTGRAIAAEREARRHVMSIFDRPGSRLHNSVALLSLLLGFLKELRQLADANVLRVRSEGVLAFLSATTADLSDDYLEKVALHLRSLRFTAGIPATVRISPGNGITDYQVDEPLPRRWRLLDLFAVPRRSAYMVTLAERDEAGASALRNMRDFSLNDLADTLEHSARHVQGYLHRLHRETAFYMGAVNVKHALERLDVATCFPEPVEDATPVLTFTSLCDAGLALRGQAAPVEVDLEADGLGLIVVTGANSGGKTTFLRSVGLAQLLTQAGLPVAARSLRTSPAGQILTHFKREEDASLTSGKLDEELARMSSLVPDLVPGSLILFNESFASTSEQEGSEIARNIVLALTRRGIRVIYVTHMFQLAKGVWDMHDETHGFLRTTLTSAGRPTYHLHVGAPQPRSNGIEMYDRVFQDVR